MELGKESAMRGKPFTEEQIIGALRDSEAGAHVIVARYSSTRLHLDSLAPPSLILRSDTYFAVRQQLCQPNTSR